MNKISLLLKFLISSDYRDYRYVRTLHIFDPEYYTLLRQKILPETTELMPDTEDPLWTYFRLSRIEMKGQKFTFETWQQCCDPHPLFDSCYYVSRNRNYIGKMNPFAHYLIKGWKQGLQPSPYFDPIYYGEQSGWSADDGDPLTHYVHHGLPAGISPASAFNTDWYLDQAPYPDGVRSNAIKHYKLYGGQGGKSPVPVFDPQFYIKDSEDRKNAAIDPFLHYLCVGEKKGGRAQAGFDGIQGLHNLQWINGCDWHICLISRKLFDQVGDFDWQRFPHIMGMLDLCYRATAAGKKNLYTPDALVTLADHGSRLPDFSEESERERALFQELYYEQLLQFERYYNIGHIGEQGHSPETFYRWLTGHGEETGLDGTGKLN